MTTSIRSDASGTFGVLQFGVTDAVTFDATGIKSGSYSPGSVTPTALSQKLTLGTAVNTTSGTGFDFTSIPSWAKRITVMLDGVSTNGSSSLILRAGTSGGIQTSGYISVGSNAGQSSTPFSSIGTDGLYLEFGAPTSASLRYGIATLALLNSATGTWVFSSTIGESISSANYLMAGGGSKTLSGILDRIRLTTVNGTDTFDAGSINILYEG